MPSLRKRVSSYFRQLSFHNETRIKKTNINENTFVTKYLQGHIKLREGPQIIYGKNPTDLPSYELGKYETGADTIIGCYSGPNGGLTTVKRIEKHLSVLEADIDFIDTQDEESGEECTDLQPRSSVTNSDINLPYEWNRKSDFVYGVSDSLYDRNQVTKNKNGDPIADCFGIIARKDSAILAVADGVNWGEKASIAAKSAIHGCLHYLNKTIFNDIKPFESLTIRTDEASTSSSLSLDNSNLINNTKEVFVCLLRAFNCAHDLILENKGMLTTLTVAVVLPLKQMVRRRGGMETQYVCCVCNVGDTLAYIYSQEFGVRELTKGSHDVMSNRDMRDALGALGPVDGTNPELSNLTLSITTLQKGDIVMVASDGLTDNFDPNVCRFTVNSTADQSKTTKKQTISNTSTVRQYNRSISHPEERKRLENVANTVELAVKTDIPQKPPVKPPRRSKPRDDTSRSSAERSSIKSSSVSEKSTSPSIENESQKSEPSAQTAQNEYNNPLEAHFMQENSITVNKPEKRSTIEHKKPVVVENKASSLRKQVSSQQRYQENVHGHRQLQKSSQTIGSRENQPAGYAFLKSKTSVDLRSSISTKQILRNEDGIPFITPIQRYELQLLLIEDILRNGISGNDSSCVTAKKLCENLLNFTLSITAAKRRTLEDQEFYFDNRNGVLVEVSNQEKKIRRKRGLEKVQNLPGKLDHVSIVAYNVGNCAY